jgi:hypothetical protein
VELEDPAGECEHGEIRAACIECIGQPRLARLHATSHQSADPRSRHCRSRKAVAHSPSTSRSNRSFLAQSDHPITFRQWSYDRLIAVVGPLDHSSRPVDVVNTRGVVMDGKVRHSVAGGGNEYFQLNCHDPQVTDGLAFGDVIHVDVFATAGRPEIRLTH